MLVADLMKLKSARVPTIRMSENVEMAATLLNRERIGAVVVKDACGSEGDTVVGIFSERDVVRAVAERGAAALKLTVGDLMSRNMISCRMEDTVDHVRALMEEHHVRHLPVLEEHQLVGVLSIRDVLSHDVRRASQFSAPIAPSAGANALPA
ncbi:CBS domain-containing protein [Ancylobacter dichloromethanicus]|uniref:Histidine kinase n=1 Tax=Ancylobacter dichloromethanicus TaxID=518825 RepID=A0A9W6JE16_9HYPH|nr:CBS domain-containing protein [Ancylobacter dichloromethanicus]MBS7553067.1 CBS domain-containing protein [Ancylobacter dichloromethanicus]GLK74583.1 histidine kinase [Ancylobacter dichloromethanicus]